MQIIHVVPGGDRNRLLEGIINDTNSDVGALTIYGPDTNLSEYCAYIGKHYYSLGFHKKSLIRQGVSLFRFLWLRKPDVIYLHSFYPSLLSIFLIPLRSRIAIIPVRHHNRVFHLSRNRKGILIDKVVNSFANHLVAVSDSVKSTMVWEGCDPQKIAVIYNGMDFVSRRPSVGNSGDENKLVQLIAIGRLDWQKDYVTMLNAMKQLKDQGLNFFLSILGSGSEENLQLLREIVFSLDLTREVRLVGWQSNVSEWLEKSDIFVHTAIDEACPLVLIEALISGIPIVSSNAGGCKDVIGKYYIGVNPGDPQGFAEGIFQVMEDLPAAREYAISIAVDASQRFGTSQMRAGYRADSIQQLGTT